MGGEIPRSKGRGLPYDVRQRVLIGVLTSQRLILLSIMPELEFSLKSSLLLSEPVFPSSGLS